MLIELWTCLFAVAKAIQKSFFYQKMAIRKSEMKMGLQFS